MTPAVSIVIPLYNEEDNVAPLQAEVAAAMANTPYELILVDDGSSDDTLARIEKSKATRVLVMDNNCGQSAAMYHGIMRAKAPIIALLDGDLQNNPHDITKLIDALTDGTDLVCGYRAKRKDTWSKRMQSRIANRIRRAFTRDGVRDTGCSLKVMRSECRDALVFFNGMHRFIPALIGGAGFGVSEMPVDHRPRKFGTSNYGFGNRAWRGLIDLFGVCWLLSRRRVLVRTKVKRF